MQRRLPELVGGSSFGRGAPEACRSIGNLNHRSGLQTAEWLRGGVDAESAAAAAMKRNGDATCALATGTGFGTRLSGVAYGERRIFREAEKR